MPPATPLEPGQPDAPLPLTPILSAALAAFTEHGYHGTSVRMIASAAGLTMPALYYHHGNKEGILLALLDVAMDDVGSHVQAATRHEDPRTRFIEVVAAVALHSSRRRDLALLHAEYRFLGAEARALYVAKRASIHDALLEAVEAGVASGDFAPDDTRGTVRAVLGLVQSIADWYRPDGPETPEQIAAEYTALALRMVAARPT